MILENFELYDFQAHAVEYVFEFFKNRKTGMLLLESPTGSGKSLIQLKLIKEIRKASPLAVVHLITTKQNIVRAYLKTLGVNSEKATWSKTKRVAERFGIFTYNSYQRKLVKGEIEPPHVLIVDEAHHLFLGKKRTDQILYYRDQCKIIGLTATGYRGTPRETREFVEMWDERKVLLTPKEALVLGIIQEPTYITVPVMDDDLLTLRNGEFAISSVRDLEECCKFSGETFFESIKKILIKEKGAGATVIEVPSIEIANDLQEYLTVQGFTCNTLTAKTKEKDRLKALADLEAAKAVLIEVSIISEGFDLPDLEVFIDAKPKNSPVDFVQTSGRAKRKSPVKKRYYCLNRNIERHAYLLEGCIPLGEIRQAQQAFPNISARNKKRVFGESLGKLKALPFETKDRVFGSFYLIKNLDVAGDKNLYAVILMPHTSKVVCCKRTDKRNRSIPNPEPKDYWIWGKWKTCELPENFKGFTTETLKKRGNGKEMTPAQKKWWLEDCERFGLYPKPNTDKREFNILPILKESGIRL